MFHQAYAFMKLTILKQITIVKNIVKCFTIGLITFPGIPEQKKLNRGNVSTSHKPRAITKTFR